MKQLIFDQTNKMEQTLTKKNFLPKVRHIQLNYVFLLFWNILGDIHREFLFLVKKVAISERSTEIIRKLVFLNMFVKGKPYIKLGFVKTSPFDQTRKEHWNKKCQILTKNVFLPKVSHIQLNYAILFFWSIFWEINREFLFLFQKMAIPERSTEILWYYCFLTCLKRVNPE